MTSNSIDVKHLTFKYDVNQEHNTLDDLSFHVKRGEWLSIIGHNGSGKSTTVRLLDGLLAAESGQIFIEGDLLTEDNVWDIRHKIGMVFQNPDNQFVGATVEDDVAFGLENKGIPLDEMKERVAKALDLVGMSEFADREPSRLSGGQKQRLAIARAIAKNPEIFIFDDSFSALDFKTDSALREALSTRTKNKTVIIVAQRISTILNADKIIVLEEGKMVGMGTHEELMKNNETYRQIALSQLSEEELGEKGGK